MVMVVSVVLADLAALVVMAVSVEMVVPEETVVKVVPVLLQMLLMLELQ